MASQETGPDPVAPGDGGLPPELIPAQPSTEAPAPYAPVDPQLDPRVDPQAVQPVAPPVGPPEQPTSPAPVGRRRTPPAPRSRVGGVWAAAVAFAIILLLLLIFVLENGQRTEISFFGQHGHLPQGVALLLAAVCGILLVAIPGTARIIQLRIRDRHHRSAEATPESTGDTAGSQSPS
jgi:uncharacterized integral membrane protein